MATNLDDIRDEKTKKLPAYAWPGGYPILYLTKQGLVVCPNCANEDTSDPVEAYDVNWEDGNLYCEDCNERIESAYADKCEVDEGVLRTVKDAQEDEPK